MRIISGKAKGNILISPSGLTTRPTADKVKEAIFNMIQTRIYDATIIDLFSGSGNLGIEALSRDAKKAYFVDNNKNSIQVINQNLKKTNLIDTATVIQMDVIASIEKMSLSGVRADIIFLDPPYLKGFVDVVLEAIFSFKLLDSDGIIVVEHDKSDEVSNVIHNLENYRIKYYGNTAISFYRLREEI